MGCCVDPHRVTRAGSLVQCRSQLLSGSHSLIPQLCLCLKCLGGWLGSGQRPPAPAHEGLLAPSLPA